MTIRDGRSPTDGQPARARTRVAMALVLLPLLSACVFLRLPRVAPEQIAPDGLSTMGTDTVRVVGVTTKDHASWRFDSTPAPRMAGDTIVARVCGAPLAVRLRSVGTLWVARPGELARPVAEADVRHALAVGHAGRYVAPESRVRLWAPSAGLEAQVATLIRAGDDSIVVLRAAARGESSGSADTTSRRARLATESVRRLQRSLGWTRWPGAVAGFEVGAAIGAVGGVIWAVDALATMRPCDRNVSGSWCNLHDIAVALTVIGLPFGGALMGGLAGGVVGSLFVTERWEDVPLDMARQRCAPLPGEPQTP
ncbi:MAG: hypothetical protein ABSG61_06500 [Gemmatimonadales bacterium]